jgi:5-(carboxyamino)imidazole ribonucleotide mutase
MPSGVPVATVAVNGAQNAGILAAQIIATSDKDVAQRMAAYKSGLNEKVQEGIQVLRQQFPNSFDK